MKKYLIVVAAVLTIAFSSCSKDSSIEPTDKEYKVSVNISNFDSNITEIKSDADVDKAMTIYLLKDDKIFKTINEAQIFDKLDILLTAGSYKLCIFYREIAAGEYSNFFYNQTDAGWFHLESKIGDIFYGKVDFEVLETNVNISDMVLKRLNSKVNIDIQNIPSEITNVELLISPTAEHLLIQDVYNFESYADDSFVPNQNDTKSIQIADPNAIEFSSLALQDASISVLFYDTTGKKVNTMDINNVSVARNHKLTLSGEYSIDGNFDVDITINKDWDGSSNGSF